MDLAVLRSFIAVAEERSFTRAALRLERSQPTVSAHVRRLEEAVGALLVHRDGGREVRLTAAGEELLAGARGLLADQEDVLARIRAVPAGGPERAVVRIGSLGRRFGRMTTQVAAVAQDLLPALEVVVVALDFRRQVRAVREREVDVAAVYPPYDSATTEELVLLPLREVARVAVLPAGHRLAGRARVAAGELAGETFLAAAEGVDPRWWGQWDLTAFGLASGRRRGAAVAGVEELVAAVAGGGGITTGSADLVQLYPDPEVAYVPLEGVPPAQVAALWHPAIAPSVIEAFAAAFVRVHHAGHPANAAAAAGG
jgi:DNA-binding transcriptional LysR family regulator